MGNQGSIEMDQSYRINSYYEFKNIYKKEENLLLTFEYSLYIASTKQKKKYIIKEYNNNFYKEAKKYVFIEKANLNKSKNKFIINLNSFYLLENKAIFIFNYFKSTLQDVKSKFTLKEIQKFLIQANEAINELNKNNIGDFILSPENIGIDKNNNFKLINLFPFYNFLDEHKLKSNSIKYINLPKKNAYHFSSNLLFNIGLLIYEMYFGMLPRTNIILKGLAQSQSKDFDSLVQQLLLEYDILKWTQYINCNFLKKISPEEKFKYLYDQKIEELTTGINLESNGISEINLSLLSYIKLNNLIWLNLSKNKIKDLGFIKKSLKNLKILIVEENSIQDLDKIFFSNLENIELLSFNSNNIKSLLLSYRAELKNLTYLSFSNNKISNITELISCFSIPNIKILNLSFNNISNISILCKAKYNYLNSLFLNNNKINNIDSLQELFPLLEILNLENNDIYNINIFSKVKFKDNIKELYLDNNPIQYFEKLNLCYFPSLEKINLPKELSLLSFKMKLFGYYMDDYFYFTKEIKKNKIYYTYNKNIKFDERISILFIPKSYYNPNDIKKFIIENIQYLNKKNSFKIISNSYVNEEALHDFFIFEVLGLSKHEKSQVKLTTNYKIDDNFIVFYEDKNKIINQKVKQNLFNLMDEYKEIHKTEEKQYNKLPNYLNKTSKKKIFKY